MMKGNWIGHILCIERKMEGRMEVKGNEEDDISSYWMILRKREDTGN